MLTYNELKEMCKTQKKVRDGEEEGILLGYEVVIGFMVHFGALEYHEGIQLMSILGNDPNQADKIILNPWRLR